MKTQWTKGLSTEKGIELKREFKSSLTVRRRLEEIINDKIKSSNSVVRNKDAYDISNWAYLQADSIGYERALLEIISLLSDENVEK